MNDHELRARLRAADPARDDSRATNDVTGRGPSWIDHLTDATMTDTRDVTEAGGRAKRWLPAAAASIVLALTATAVVTSRGDEQAPPAAQPGPVMTLTLPADDAMASCIQFSVEVLRPMEVAFSGTATTVEDRAVVIKPDRWYKGDDGSATVKLTTPGPEMVALIGSVKFEQGKRYLITATDGQVNSCGFSAEWSPEMAAAFEQAFG